MPLQKFSHGPKNAKMAIYFAYVLLCNGFWDRCCYPHLETIERHAAAHGEPPPMFTISEKLHGVSIANHISHFNRCHFHTLDRWMDFWMMHESFIIHLFIIQHVSCTFCHSSLLMYLSMLSIRTRWFPVPNAVSLARQPP